MPFPEVENKALTGAFEENRAAVRTAMRIPVSEDAIERRFTLMGHAAALPGRAAIVLPALLFFCCACVLPGTRLSFRPGYALRLQLLMEMSPSVLSWSLMLMAEMLLYLAGFTVCADLMRKSLQCPLRRPHVPLLPAVLLCVPPAVMGMGRLEGLLTRLLPWRYPVAAAAMALCLADNLIIRRKEKSS